MAGPFWVAGGFAALLATWLPAPYNFAVMMAVIVIVSLVPVIYSYFAYRNIAAEDD